MTETVSELYDIAVIGGGINGVGIAADAAGRGLSVFLCERDDLASHTSSASSKLIHGGLRYLEHYEFRLVREALAEREVLLAKAPHIVKPMRFVLPHRPHLRPAWMIRAGLFLYDNLGKREKLPPSRGLRLGEESPLEPAITRGFEYSDCWVDDARLVVLNAMAAREKGAHIHTRTQCTHAKRAGGIWHVELQRQDGSRFSLRTKALVNAAGPWAPLVGRMAGLDLPVDPRRRHIFVTDAFDGVRHPLPLVTDCGSGFYCRSEQGAVLMSPGDIGSATAYEAQVDWSVLETAVEKAVRRIPALEGAQVRHAWAGLRPLTPDGRAILDWAPGVEGLFLAVGFCGHGFQHSPAVGEVVASLLLDGRCADDLSDLRLDRFPRLDTVASGR